MGIASWIIFGALAGWLAGRLRGDPRRGCLTDIVIGVGGALLGGSLSAFATGEDRLIPFSPTGLLTAIAGSALLLFLLRRVGSG